MNYYGGLCLDGHQTIPEEYKDLVYIGQDVVIKTGTILCGDGFGYHFPSMEHKEHRHGVQIHDSVHIGSLCTIDRGRHRDTIIKKNTKIDNLVHVAHNVIIGEGCLIGPRACLLGSVEVGDHSIVWSGAIIHQGVKIGNNCIIGANSYVRHDVPDGQMWYGSPATFINSTENSRVWIEPSRTKNLENV